jgi:hypothetical protein
MTNVEGTLNDREKTHGSFADVSCTAQALKSVIHAHARLRGQSIDARATEAMDLICTKLARIVNGNAREPDHWHDIAGYATLVEQSLKT